MTTSTLSKAAANYIDSLISQGKIFTVNTVKNQFPNEIDAQIQAYATAAVKKTYIICPAVCYIPKSIFASANANKSKSVNVVARQSTLSGRRVLNVPISATTSKTLGLSVRSYRYEIKGSNITIHRDSKNTNLQTLSIWRTGRGAIPVSSTGTFTITVV